MISGEQDKPGMAERNWEGAGAGGGGGGLQGLGVFLKIFFGGFFSLKWGGNVPPPPPQYPRLRRPCKHMKN